MSLAGLCTRPGYAIYHAIWKAIDWLYPPHCGGCGKLGERYCADCLDNTRLVGENICHHCGNLLSEGNLCTACQVEPPACQQLRSWGIFIGPLRLAIHEMKYKRDLGLTEYFAKHLIDKLHHLNWHFDVITVVPLGANRLRERGYNQSALLARPVGLAFNRPFIPKALHRNRETRSQVGLTISERLLNVSGAFSTQGDLVRGKMVLIIDDVTTTGATIQSCARSLIDSGASAVYGLTLARTTHPASQGDGSDGGTLYL